MAIILPFPLTVQEMRVLQEYRRAGTESLTRDAIKAIKHPVGGGDTPALSLTEKGYLTAGENQAFTLTQKAKDFLAIDVKPDVEAGPDSGEAVE